MDKKERDKKISKETWNYSFQIVLIFKSIFIFLFKNGSVIDK